MKYIKRKAAQTLSKQLIKWEFNPTISAWIRRVWEVLVKTVKQALKTVTRQHLFTEDPITTFLSEVESIFNQRPLTPKSDGIDEFEALKPQHFPLCLLSSNPSPGDFNDSQLNFRTKWNALQVVTNMF